MPITDEIKEVKVKFAIAFEFTPKQGAKRGTNKWSINSGLPWNINDPASLKFAQDLDGSFNARAKTYTNLSTDSIRIGSLANALENFKALPQPVEADFTTMMTGFATHQLKGEFDTSQLKTKFIVTAVLYEVYTKKNGVPQQNTLKEILNISMIRASEALQFDNHYRITKIPAIDFSQLLQSARIDTNAFKDNLTAQPDDVHSDMSFIAGKGDIRDYFFRGLGAQDYVKNKLAADNLLDGLKHYLSSIGLSRVDRISIQDTVHAYLSSPKRKDGALIEDIERQLDAHLPPKFHACKGTFIEFLTDNDYEVNEKIAFSPAQRDRLVWVDLDINTIKMRFRLKDVGTKNSTSPLRYDAATGTLSFEEKVTDPEAQAVIQRAING